MDKHGQSLTLRSQKMEAPGKKLSFCIQCKDRLWQLRQTLPKNLKDNTIDANDIEFVLVDFDSRDGLYEWVTTTLEHELESGYLKYYFTEELPSYNACLAKNTCHLLGTGEILTNLDGDNFTGKRGGRYVCNSFRRQGLKIVLHQWSGNWHDGTCGRISCLKKHFVSIGGYDESFDTVGYEDLDLIKRLEAMHGLRTISGVTNPLSRRLLKGIFNNYSNPRYNRAVKNIKSETWIQTERRNRQLSEKNIREKRFIANAGRFGIHKNIYRYLQGELRLVELEASGPEAVG